MQAITLKHLMRAVEAERFRLPVHPINPRLERRIELAARAIALVERLERLDRLGSRVERVALAMRKH